MDEAAQTKLYPCLEETPDFKEALEKCSSIEDVIEALKKGTDLWKVRSFSKWYRRKYYLDTVNMRICYDSPNHGPCYSSKKYVDMCDLVDVRKGWKTDVFNKIESKVEKNQRKKPDRPPLVEEKVCFSLIHGKQKESLDLVAPDERICDVWVRGLQHLLTVVKSLEQEKNYETWLKKQFKEADRDKNGSLNFEECLKLLKQLNIKMSRLAATKLFEEANTNNRERNGEQVLDEDEFVKFYFKLTERPELKELFEKYALLVSNMMNATELCQLLQKEQAMSKITVERCHALIEAFEQSNIKSNGLLSFVGFCQMMLSEEFEIFNPAHRIIYQDMTQPLSHYYIASSHNTYLTGHQLSGESSVEGYIEALKRGCRCVELDCWDGPDGEPIIYHGYTLTTKILLRDVLADAIKPHAFETSEYPVILSLENHCSVTQQERLAKHIREVLKGMMYDNSVDDKMAALPSPEELKHKIIIKAKKLDPKASKDDDPQEESDTDDEPDVTYADADEHQTRQLKQNKKIVAKQLSDLVNICQAVHFHGFSVSREEGKCFHMSSFSEAKAEYLMDTNLSDFVEYNKRQLSRIYPSGKRTGSSNFKPMPFWNVGCQIVALNYQTAGKPVFFNDSKFRQNGSCGYVLKPEFLRSKDAFDPNRAFDNRSQTVLKIKVISGQHLPKPDQSTKGEVVDPYVIVKIMGHPKDKQKHKTKVIRNNGLNPNWNDTMTIPIRVPDLALVYFVVKDFSSTAKNETLGVYALPFTSLQQGYRHVYLMDYGGKFLTPASLFVHVSTSG